MSADRSLQRPLKFRRRELTFHFSPDCYDFNSEHNLTYLSGDGEAVLLLATGLTLALAAGDLVFEPLGRAAFVLLASGCFTDLS